MPARAFGAAAACLALCAAPARAEPAAALPDVRVLGTYDNAVGAFDAASEGAVTARLLQNRPTLRPAEVLEFVPGVIVTQHSGDGKANQYFLRGFNLDHGTDFATWVDGMPVNMVSHAHGQGYSDLNWLIPELVARIAYRKGPYSASEGDFSSAGAAHLQLADTLPRNLAEAGIGERGFRRGLLAGSTTAAAGNLLYALEAAHNDGPWIWPERFHRSNAVLRYSRGPVDSRWSVTAMAYTAGWNATDQVPLRAVNAGALDRFGTVDPSDGGQTSRQSVSWDWRERQDAGEWRTSAYAVRSRLNLWSDFSYGLQHPTDDPAAGTGALRGDQFAQYERRQVVGGALARTWSTPLAGREGSTTIGLQARADRVDPLGLADTQARALSVLVQESRVRQASTGVYASNQTQWLPWLRSTAGLRWDNHRFDVRSSIAGNSGQRTAAIASPKLSLAFGPWARTELFANAGTGFHSNDARGTVAHVAPREGTVVDPVTPLVRSRGSELGVRSEAIPGLQSSLVAWQLALASELVFSGDAGDTQPSRASRRSGVEWNNHWRAGSWLLLDADLAWSRARFVADGSGADFIPGAVSRVASLGATVTAWGRWSGNLQLRYFGPRPLTADGAVRSAGTTLAYLRVGYRAGPGTKLTLDVFNLLNRRASDIDYVYASRLPGEPAGGVADVHFHPVEPRTVRLALTQFY